VNKIIIINGDSMADAALKVVKAVGTKQNVNLGPE